MSAYKDMMAFQRETEALSSIAGRLGWDQETVMPSGASGLRGEEMAALDGVLHARQSDPRVGDWLAGLDEADLTEIEQANCREIRRRFERSNNMPAELSAALARTTSTAFRVWESARSNNDFSEFSDVLSEIVDLKRQEANALAAGGNPYDALVQDYEPGASGDEIAGIFSALRPGLVSLVDRGLGLRSRCQSAGLSI